MNCSRCGATIEEGMRSCPQCGAPINTSPKRPARQFSIPKRRSHKGLVAVVLLIIAAAAVVGYLNNWFGLI